MYIFYRTVTMQSSLLDFTAERRTQKGFFGSILDSMKKLGKAGIMLTGVGTVAVGLLPSGERSDLQRMVDEVKIPNTTGQLITREEYLKQQAAHLITSEVYKAKETAASRAQDRYNEAVTTAAQTNKQSTEALLAVSGQQARLLDTIITASVQAQNRGPTFAEQFNQFQPLLTGLAPQQPLAGPNPQQRIGGPTPPPQPPNGGRSRLKRKSKRKPKSSFKKRKEASRRKRRSHKHNK
jgi:hypothetical protein